MPKDDDGRPSDFIAIRVNVNAHFTALRKEELLENPTPDEFRTHVLSMATKVADDYQTFKEKVAQL